MKNFLKSLTNTKNMVNSISRMLGWHAKNDETREKLGVGIRDTSLLKPNSQIGKYYVYVILCEDGSLYIGQTNNLQVRWEQHRQGKGALWTKTHAPIKIVHFEELGTLEEAVKREKDLKTGFGRKWLKKLVASNSSVDIRLPAASPAHAQAGGSAAQAGEVDIYLQPKI